MDKPSEPIQGPAKPINGRSCCDGRRHARPTAPDGPPTARCRSTPHPATPGAPPATRQPPHRDSRVEGSPALDPATVAAPHARSDRHRSSSPARATLGLRPRCAPPTHVAGRVVEGAAGMVVGEPRPRPMPPPWLGPQPP